MDTDKNIPAECAVRKDRTIKTIEAALQVCAEKIASAKFAAHARKHATGKFDQSFIIQIKHHKEGFVVVLEFRQKTPAFPLLVIQDLA